MITFEHSANVLITFVLECIVFVEKRADSETLCFLDYLSPEFSTFVDFDIDCVFSTAEFIKGIENIFVHPPLPALGCKSSKWSLSFWKVQNVALCLYIMLGGLSPKTQKPFRINIFIQTCLALIVT